MTDPAAHWSPSEIDDDGDRASYPPAAGRDAREVLDHCARALAEHGVAAPLDVIAATLDEHVCNLLLRVQRVTASRDAAEASLRALACAVRREHNTRLAWLATLPDGSCPNPPPQALLDAEAATRDALRRVA